MEISNKDNKKLEEIFNLVNNDINIECELKVNKVIYFDKFVNLLNIVKNTINNEYKIEESLDIFFPNYNIRTSIIGKNNIEIYCKNNKIKEIDNNFIEEVYKSKLEDFNRYNFEKDDDIYINLKNEIVKDKDTGIFNILDTKLNNKIKKEQKILNNKFDEMYKFFRYKKRYSIFDKNNIFRFDFTIVKTTESNGKSIFENNLFKCEEKYEIEIEYVNKLDNFNKFRNELIKNTALVLKCLINSNFIINKKEEEIVRYTYYEYVRTMFKNSLKEKKLIKENKFDIDDYKYKLFNNLIKKTKLTDITDEEKKIDIKNNKSLLLNPKPITLNMNHLRNDSNINILNNYSVTEKADGETMLLYVLGINHLTKKEKEICKKYEGNIYLIDMNENVFKTRIKDLDNINTIISGEYIRNGINGSKLNYFAAFDIYNNTINGNLIYYPFYGESKEEIYRYNMLKSSIISINKKLDINKFGGFVLKYKDFYFGNNEKIFELSGNLIKKIKNKEFPYYTDGLIYTPINIPVNYTNTPFFDLYISNTWNKNFKWKPYYDNSIDFLVKIEQEEIDYGNGIKLNKDIIKTKIIDNPNGIEYKKYKILNLYVGYGYDLDNYNPCNRKSNNYKYKPTKFKPSRPSDNEAYICYLELNDEDDIVDDKGYVIKSDTIVEFVYLNFKENEPNFEKDKSFRWKPLRTRYDKTLEYKEGLKNRKDIFNIIEKRKDPNNKLTKFELNKIKNIKNINNIHNEEDVNYNIRYGNDYNTANNIWFNIHDTITEEMISTGINLNKKEDEDKYYNRDLNISREKSITYKMQKFHNIEIKQNTLLLPVSKYIKKKNKYIKLLDLACGKAGDLYKWNKSNIDLVVGIDINHNNIYHHIDGACKRYEDYINKYKNENYTECYFLVGDSSKNIKKKKAFNDQESIDLLNSINKIMIDKFDIVSLQFAIHYFFKNENSLNNLINNIVDNLKVNGYFIGTCFDGQTIFNLLKENEKVERINKDDGSIFWKIEKLYDKKRFNNFNMEISVFLNSINNTISEYLVKFDYLVKKLKEKNIVLLNEDECKKININSSSDLFNSKYNDKYNMNEFEKEISFMYRYFIFKRIE